MILAAGLRGEGEDEKVCKLLSGEAKMINFIKNIKSLFVTIFLTFPLEVKAKSNYIGKQIKPPIRRVPKNNHILFELL